jgi:secretion/DNA translocation related TadE-like protein
VSVERATRERGAVSVVALGLLVVALALTLGAARLGVALIGRARAESAADAAALAAADALAVGEGSGAAATLARDTAARNGARLVQCECAGHAAEVVVEVDVPGLTAIAGAARGHARAEVRPECAWAECG